MLAIFAAAALSAPASLPIAPPEGYRLCGAVLRPPIEAIFVKKTLRGEAEIIVESLPSTGPGLAGLRAGLGLKDSKPSRLESGGRVFEVFCRVPLEIYNRSVQAGDPYADALGPEPRPSLGLFDRRLFPRGGEAFRLWRCRRLDAWDLLSDYKRAREDPQALFEFKAKRLRSAERNAVSACFGIQALAAMEAGEPVPDFPKPSARSLRRMAEEERESGASRREELECVHLRLSKGAPQALILRAPKEDYPREMEAFKALLSSLPAD